MVRSGVPRRRLALLAFAALGVAFGVAVWIALSTADAREAASRVRELGPAGALVLLVALVLQCVVSPIPSEPIMMLAGFVYGLVPGFTLSWLGVVLGAVACFALARAFGRALAVRLVAAEKLDAMEHFVRTRSGTSTILGVLAARVLAFGAFDVLSYACGLVGVPFRWYLVATLAGAVPKVFVFTYAGAVGGERPAWIDGVILAGTFGIVVAWLAWRLTGGLPGVRLALRGEQGERS
ncbi:MAG: VTT domain-containing protein [Thermodesulfobacteriota bacterium]